jgi:transcriptional regulator with XRE-family HTH domain
VCLTVNRGVSLLGKAVEAAGDNESEVARALDFDQSYVNRVLRCERSPGLEFRKKCKELYGISLDDWEEELPPDTERTSS